MLMIRGMALAALVLLAGCGSAATPRSAATPTASRGSPATPTASGGTVRVSSQASCGPAALRVTVNASQAGTAMGSTYYPVDFVNTSRSTCGMDGYPGMSFVTAGDAAARQVGAAAQQDPAFGRLPVRLAAGAAAHAWLQVAQAVNYPPSECRPVRVHWLRVITPGQAAPSFVSFSVDACASAKVPLLSVMPVRAGRGLQGRTP
jgi:hypothetical protein